MTTTKHTPGPWYIEMVTPDDWQINSDRRSHCLVQMTPTIGKSKLSKEDKANAFLIAAAPELLTWLKWALPRTPESVRDSWQYEQAKAAIEKAQGGNNV